MGDCGTSTTVTEKLPGHRRLRSRSLPYQLRSEVLLGGRALKGRSRAGLLSLLPPSGDSAQAGRQPGAVPTGAHQILTASYPLQP